MADQDFKINIRTIADTTGIRLTEQQLKALQTAAEQGNQKAIAALKQLANAQKEAASVLNIGAFAGGIAGGALGSLVGVLINQWREFNEEQDKVIENMEKARERSYALGLSLVDTFEEMRSAERIDTEPLEQSFDRLTQKTRALKTEIKLAFEAGSYDDVKKLIAQLNVYESQLNRTTNAIERQKNETKRLSDEREKAAEKERKESESFARGAVTSADLNVQAALRNEAEARRTGDQLFQKTAEDYKKGFTPAEREQYEQLAGNKEVIQAIEDLRRDLVGLWR